MRQPAITLFLVLVITVSGCAEHPMVMRLTIPEPGASRIWPDPPETPRYRYVGELTGEDNFQTDDGVGRSTASKLFDWLVGLTGFSDKPVILQRPQTGMVDADGRIYVTDISRGAIYAFDKLAGQLEVWERLSANEKLASPIGIAQGRQGEILVVDAELHSVFRLNNKGELLGEFGRDILKRPTGLARDAQRGVIYVSDTHAHDIKVFGDDGSLLKVIGQRGEGDGQLNFPTHLAFAADKLYVTDTLNSRVQIFDADGNAVTKFGERGLFVGNMVRPKGIAVDSAGNIYVIESLHDRLLVFDSAGRFLLGIGGSGQGRGEFYLPAGVWVDSQDQVYIADMFNGRVTVLQFLGSTQ